MRLSNLARIVLSAGAISLFTANPAKAQEPNLETKIIQTSETALTQSGQSQISNFNLFFSELYQKIRDWEFYYEQVDKKDSRWYRREVAKQINDDMRKLLARYGADFAFESVSDSYAFSIAGGFVVNFSLLACYG